eukprot:18298_1
MEEPTDLGSVDIDFSFDVDDEVTVPVSSPSPIRNDSSAITPKKPPSTKVQSKPPRDFQDEVSTDFQIDSSAKQDNDEDLDDEFDVWDGEAPKQQKHSPSPPRRVLKASKQQQQFESKKAAVLEAQNLEKKQKEAEISEEVSSDTLMHTPKSCVQRMTSKMRHGLHKRLSLMRCKSGAKKNTWRKPYKQLESSQRPSVLLLVTMSS